MAYAQGTSAITSTASVLVAEQAGNDIVVHNRGPVSVFLGGSTVIAATDQQNAGGVEVHPGEKLTIPGTTPSSDSLYAVTASGTAYVAVLLAP